MIDNANLDGTRVDLIDTSANFNDNQKVIDELEKLKEFFVDEDDEEYTTVSHDIFDVVDYIDNRIKELKGE